MFVQPVGQWCIAKNGGEYTQTGVAKGLKVPCLFMIAEVSIRCQKNPAYTRVYPPIQHCGWVNYANEPSQAAPELANQDVYDAIRLTRSKAAMWTVDNVARLIEI